MEKRFNQERYTIGGISKGRRRLRIGAIGSCSFTVDARIVHPWTSFALKRKRRGLEDSYEFETSRHRHCVKLNAIT
eukprot:UN22442